MKIILRAVVVFGVALVVGLPANVHAGGIELYEIASPDVGLASAGYAARAQDASTLFKNPAGMSNLDAAQFQGGLQVLYADVEFSPDSNTSARLGTIDGGQAVGWLPGGSGFFVLPVGEKLRLGLGTFSYFGLGSEYDHNWVGRYYVQKGVMIGMTIMPAASYQITDWLSVGAGLNAMYGYFDTDVAINNLEPTQGDGQVTLQDYAWGFGANAGILIEPNQRTRFGLTYLSPVNLDFQDKPSFKNLGPGLSAILGTPSNVDLGLTVPQGVMLGVYHECTDKLALMCDVGWQDWSQFGRVEIGVQSGTSPDITLDANYQDTWHAAIGAMYKANEKLQLTGGFAYDSSAVSDSDRTLTVPMGVAYRIGLGALWQKTETMSVNASYEFVWAGDMPVDQGTDASLRGRVAGAYDNVWSSFFTVNATWKY